MVSSWSYKLSLCRGKKGRKRKAVISSPIVKASRKWRRVASPLNDKQTNVGTPKQLTTPKKITSSPLVNRPKSQSKRKLFQSPGKLQEKQLKLDSDFSVAEDPSFWSVDVDEDYEEYSLAMEKMPERRRAIQTFFKLLNENSFPLNNVAFHLFCDAVEFYENKGNQCIRYSDRSKTFWWTGKKLFHGKFLRFMGGLKETDNINFAIPDDRVLRDFNPFDVKIPSKLNPGFQEELANIGKKAFEGASCILSVDGKKITPGLSTDFGDIDLLGFESRSSLQERRNEHASDLNEINEFQTYVERLVDHDVEVWYDGLKTRLQKVQCIIFRHLRQLRESMKNATIACEKFKTKAGSDWKTSRLQFVINSYETLKIRIDICLKELMDANERICHQLAIMNGTDHLFAHDSYVDVAYQRNLHELKEPSEIHDLTPKYTKQRSEQWFELRKCVKLTGSTIHNGLGLDGLKKQKEHFKQQFCSTEHIFNDAQTAAMKWGKDNEANAMATLASVVAPVLFPNKLLCEEGAYFIESEDGTRIIEVSPDGSLKSEPEGQAEYGIEIKCPVPGKIYSTDVHYALPSRYFCQCLAEMAALMPISEKLIYLCWTPESTTVFEMSNSENVWSKIEAETKAVYYKQNPSIPTRISQTAKSIKADLSDLHSSVQFLGEFPSKKAFETGDTERPRPDSRLLYHKEPMHKPRSSCVVTIKELKNITEVVKPAISKSFNLRRNKASEVVTYILVDTDRLSKPDSIPLVPVAYFLRGYSLNSEQMRKITEMVQDKLSKTGIHVPAVTMDGEWAKLVFYSAAEKPLTLLSVQKTFYNDLRSNSKKDLVDYFRGLIIFQWTRSGNTVEVNLINSTQIIKTPTNGWRGREDSTDAETSESSSSCSEAVSSTLENLPDEDAGNLQTLLLSDTESENAVTNIIFENIDTTAVTTNNLASIQVPRNMFDDDLFSESENVDHSDIVNDGELHDVVDEDIESVTQTQIRTGNVNRAKTSNNDKDSQNRIDFGEKDIQQVYNLVKVSSQGERWKNKSLSDFEDCLKSAESLNKLTDVVLRTVLGYIKPKLKSKGINVMLSARKADKVNTLSKYIGDGSEIVPKFQSRAKPKPVMSLKEICVNCLNRQKYPKEVLLIARATYEFPIYVDKWHKEAPIAKSTEILGEEITFLYKPEFSVSRNQIEIKFLDGHHLLTNLRSKTSNGGIKRISKEAWREVAKAGNTPLKLVMVDENIDQQSDSFARTHFSPPVEQEMRRLGFNEEAELCRLVTDWIQAEDAPGLSSRERCQKRLAFRKWLLQDVDLMSFPPPGRYVRGMPVVNWDGFVSSIDAHLQLYALTKSGTYNNRAITTLSAEQFNGMIEQVDGSGRKSVTAESYRTTLADICMLSALQVQPDRDHEFDLIVKPEKEMKFRTISEPDAPGRGRKSVRQYHRLDETKLKASQRFNTEIKKNMIFI